LFNINPDDFTGLGDDIEEKSDTILCQIIEMSADRYLLQVFDEKTPRNETCHFE
jgi:hypothetical protein